jgi:hypothetical protein
MEYMVLQTKREFTLREKDREREERINSRLNLKKLPDRKSVV